MHIVFKKSLWLLMSIALAFGFLHHFIAPELCDFERLHIFLFNLVCGGTVLLVYTEKTNQINHLISLFFAFTLLFAFAAFVEWYLSAICIAIALAIIVDIFRRKQFAQLPSALFHYGETLQNKFHQAALLCLSLALLLSVFAMINSEFTHWFQLEKLTLNTFFLGYSFPVSLISMSVIFSLMKCHLLSSLFIVKEFSFWAINLGVIIFFLFILCDWFIPQVYIATFLFFSVAVIFFLFLRECEDMQEKMFLLSAMIFLIVTSVSGIGYILLELSGYYQPKLGKPLLQLHVFTSLYGWNLGGLIVIIRQKDFPIQLHAKNVIALHWITVCILCPLGYFFPFFAIIAVICYSVLLYILLFTEGVTEKNNDKIIT